MPRLFKFIRQVCNLEIHFWSSQRYTLSVKITPLPMAKKMKPRHSLPFLTGLITLAFLVQITLISPPTLALLPTTVLFGVLIIFTMTFAISLGGGMLSLTSMTILAAYMVVGPVMAAWAAFIGALVHSIIRYSWAEEIEQPLEYGLISNLSLAFATAGVNSLCILAAGSIYQNAGGKVPLVDLGLNDLIPLLFLGASFISLNHLLAGAYMALHGRDRFDSYVDALTKIIVFEAYTFVFAPLVTLIYARLGLAVFVIFAFAIVLTSLALNNLASARQRLERRIKELGSLQAVGKALSGSLDLNTILSAIYSQVSTLMPTENFFIALYDSKSDEITFPLEMDNGKKVQVRAHQNGDELAEYIMRTQRPLLIRKGMHLNHESPGLNAAKKPPASFLGVPLMAGNESLGVIVVQSFSTPGLYDGSHKEVLITIASQAAMAIQNARLYALTDKALAHRVQELDSILRTTTEGILLLDANWRIKAANRTLAEFLGVPQQVITGASLGSRREDNGSALMDILGYSAEALREDCRQLNDGKEEYKKQTIVLPKTPGRHFGRTLTPVRDRSGEISGYLIVLRDMTEEQQLEKLRSEMTHMLIHDLRSPLTTLQSVVNVVQETLDDGKIEDAYHLLSLAQQSGDKMLHLIDELLEISKLEGDRIPLKLKAVQIERLLKQVVDQFVPLAENVQISVAVEVDPETPPVMVDVEYIERVINNLIDNAYKFTPDGGTIRVWARKSDASNGGGVLIGVSDTGPGIPEKEQNRLFRKFQQVISNSGRRSGTGLGLVYCKLAIEAHGGKIWVESQPGKGSTFLVNLPIPA